MENKNIFLVVQTWANIDCGDEGMEINCFDSFEAANKYYSTMIEELKVSSIDNDWMVEEHGELYWTWGLGDTLKSFSTYEDGYYSQFHEAICIMERKLKTNVIEEA
jgi:hypothetical protein